MLNLNLKGIWIPIEILTDKNLSDKEKNIYSLIIFLSQEKQYCFCTNKTISELLNISITQVSNLINSLKSKHYINTELIYKENSKQVDMRKLIPLKNLDTYPRKFEYHPQENFNTPIKENFKDNKYNNKNINKINKGRGEKNNKTNYEGRDYSNFNWNSLYANADIFVEDAFAKTETVT